MYEILTQELPWKDMTALQTSKEIGEGRRSPIPANCSPPSELMAIFFPSDTIVDCLSLS